MDNLTGLFIGKVLKNIDTLKQERIFVRILGVHDIKDNFADKEYGIWVENGIAIKNFNGYVPDINDFVYIMFIDNNPMFAVYFGIVRHQII